MKISLFLEKQKKACKDSKLAYYFALNNKNADIKKCQEAACK